MIRGIFLSLLVLFGCGPTRNTIVKPQGPWTRAELSNATATSSLADVNAFISNLKSQGAPIAISTLGKSAGGLDIPLVVLADPPCRNGDDARASGRAVVYLQANIHGGEVEGKETAQMLLREASRGQRPSWLENLVLVFVPIYNVDGNEALGPGLQQRGHQDGPDPIGRRTNNNQLDLNRDCLKADSPEMRGVLEHVWKVWDPHVVLDLHTTNGTRHGYRLTYSPPLGADVDPAIQHWSKNILLKDVSDKLREKHGVLTFDYGNSSRKGQQRTWTSFSPFPRYVTNHAGERNRFGILSEATSFLPFSDRIESTTLFTATVIDHVADHVVDVIRICEEADQRSCEMASQGEKLGLAFEPKSRGQENVWLERQDSGSPTPAHKAPRAVEQIPHQIFADFQATRSRTIPTGWLIPREETQLIERIRYHDLNHQILDQSDVFTVEAFWITQVKLFQRPYQGRIQQTIRGELREQNHSGRIGDVWVPAQQPQVRIAFWLLEADSPDGATNWSILRHSLRKESPHPVLRVL